MLHNDEERHIRVETHSWIMLKLGGIVQHVSETQKHEGRAGQDRTGQDRTGQGRAGQGMAWQGMAGQE